MPLVQERFQVMAPPTEVWRKATDFPLWAGFLAIPEPERGGMGGRFARVDGEGADARIGMFSGGALVQVLKVTDWLPPQRMTLGLQDWNAEAATRVMTPYTGRVFARLHASWNALTARFSLDISPGDVAKITSSVCFEIEAEFTHPFFGPAFAAVSGLLGPFDPIRSALHAAARNFSRNLPASFERASNTG